MLDHSGLASLWVVQSREAAHRWKEGDIPSLKSYINLYMLAYSALPALFLITVLKRNAVLVPGLKRSAVIKLGFINSLTKYVGLVIYLYLVWGGLTVFVGK